jgi:hypothetical protein
VSAATEWVVAGSAGVSAVCVVIATRLGVRQLKEAHTGNRFAALARVTDMLIDPPVMKARRWVSAQQTALETAHFADLAESEQYDLEEVWRAYDRVGLLFDHDLVVDESPVLDMWGYSIERTYEMLEHLLEERRNSRGNPNFAHNFETLYHLVKGRRPKKILIRPFALDDFEHDLDSIVAAAREAGPEFEIDVESPLPMEPGKRAVSGRSILEVVGSSAGSYAFTKVADAITATARSSWRGTPRAQHLAENAHRQDRQPGRRGSARSQGERRSAAWGWARGR